MMDGNPDDPTRENWGGSYIKFQQSPRSVFNRNTSIHDTLSIFSIIEFNFKGPIANIPKDSACLTMTVKSEIGEQKWDGFYLGNGHYTVRYSPKRPEAITYKVTSGIKGFTEQSGAFVVENKWPRKPGKANFKLGSNWYTDRPNPELFDGIWQGGKTVLNWRSDVLLDWAERWNWLR